MSEEEAPQSAETISVNQLEKRIKSAKLQSKAPFAGDDNANRSSDIADTSSANTHEDSDTFDLPPLPMKPPLYNPPVYSIGDLTDLEGQENLQLKDFKIIQLAGKGGFGKVYQVCRQSDKRIFALKTMRKDMIIEMGQVCYFIELKVAN